MAPPLEGADNCIYHILNSFSERSATTVPAIHTETSGSRGFSYDGPTAWNGIPDYLKQMKDVSLANFKKHLKSHFSNITVLAFQLRGHPFKTSELWGGVRSFRIFSDGGLAQDGRPYIYF